MHGDFLQSKEWEDFQTALGRKTFRIQNCLLIKMPLPLGESYFYSPRADIKKWKQLSKEVQDLAQKQGAIFWRVEPVGGKWQMANSKWQMEGFVKTAPVQPSQTLILPLTSNPETLLAQMKQKTRYNIRLAQKRGIEVREDKGKIDQFLKLLHLTAKREQFTAYPDNYYQKMVGVLGDKVDLFLAYFQNQPIAGILTLYYLDTSYYLHGGSDYHYRDLMASYLLQWQAILAAQKRGAKYYDFWGVATAPNHPWAGITRFKMGFGGKVVDYPGAFDLPISQFWYRMYCWGRKVL